MPSLASNWQTFCDALIADLQANIVALTDVRVHRYAPWDPESTMTEAGERHLSVFPDGDAVVGEPMTTASNELTELYRIRYWEQGTDNRGIADPEAAVALFDLAQAVQDRLHTTTVWTLGGAFHVQYQGTRFPERSTSVMWFEATLSARRAKDIT